MSEQTNSIWAASCSPMTVKKPWKDSMVRSLPIQSKRVSPPVDLVDQGQVFVTFGVLDFIHTNGADRLQCAMFQTPADHTRRRRTPGPRKCGTPQPFPSRRAFVPS